MIYATTYFIQNWAYLDDQVILFGRTVFFPHWLEGAWVCFVIINWFYRQWQTNTNDSLAPDTKHSFQLVHFHPTAGTHLRDDVFSLLSINVAGTGEGEKIAQRLFLIELAEILRSS